MKTSITIEVTRLGEMTVDVNGVKDKSCHALTAAFTNLGKADTKNKSGFGMGLGLDTAEPQKVAWK